MEGGFYTLQEFMTYTKGITYIIMIVSLCAFAGFWLFLSDQRNSRDTMDRQPEKHLKEKHH